MHVITEASGPLLVKKLFYFQTVLPVSRLLWQHTLCTNRIPPGDCVCWNVYSKNVKKKKTTTSYMFFIASHSLSDTLPMITQCLWLQDLHCISLSFSYNVYDYKIFILSHSPWDTLLLKDHCISLSPRYNALGYKIFTTASVAKSFKFTGIWRFNKNIRTKPQTILFSHHHWKLQNYTQYNRSCY